MGGGLEWNTKVPTIGYVDFVPFPQFFFSYMTLFFPFSTFLYLSTLSTLFPTSSVSVAPFLLTSCWLLLCCVCCVQTPCALYPLPCLSPVPFTPSMMSVAYVRSLKFVSGHSKNLCYTHAHTHTDTCKRALKHSLCPLYHGSTHFGL